MIDHGGGSLVSKLSVANHLYVKYLPWHVAESSLSRVVSALSLTVARRNSVYVGRHYVD